MKMKRLNKLDKQALNYYYDKLFKLEDKRDDLSEELSYIRKEIEILGIKIIQVKQYGVENNE